MTTVEMPDEVLEALKILIVYCLMKLENPMYHKAEIINTFLQGEGLI